MARNFIDRCFEAVAPVHAVRRSAARTALQFLNSGYGNYGANLTKKSMRGWEYHGGSSKEDIEDNIDVLRQRSRDAYMGVPVAASALKTLRTNVVAGGLMPAPQIDGAFLGLSAEQTEELQEKIIREFSLWADTPECDMDGLGTNWTFAFDEAEIEKAEADVILVIVSERNLRSYVNNKPVVD